MNSNKLKITTLFLLVIFTFFAKHIMGQVPTTGDCLGAIAVCQDSYFQPNTADGEGNYPNEIKGDQQCDYNCLWGERNSTWYRFTVQTSGLLRFIISPVQQTDDYDWAVYNISSYRCEDIYNQAPQMVVSCNSVGSNNNSAWWGDTGATEDGLDECSGPGELGSKWNIEIPVNQGETYVLYVSDWSQTPPGYSLDFSASTAQIFDDIRPEISVVIAGDIQCGDDSFVFKFSEDVSCETVTPGSFQVTGPDGIHEVIDITGEACEVGGLWEKEYTATVDPPFTVDGDYIFELLAFTNVSDACDNIALPQQYGFTCDLGAPEILEENINVTNSTCGQSNGSVSGLEVDGNGPFSYEWYDQDDNLVGEEIDLVNISAGQYTLHVSDPAGCKSSSGPHTVSDEGAPEIDESQMNVIPNTCDQQNGSVTGIIVEGFEPFTYEWTDENANVVGVDLDLVNVDGGEYFLKIIDDNACEAFSGPFTVEDFPSPEIIGNQAFIIGENCQMENGSIEDVVVNGSTDLEYRWFNTSGDTVGFDAALFDAPAGDYQLLVRDMNMCVTVSEVFTIPEISGPEINESNLQLINATCEQSNGVITGLQFTGNSGLTYEWTDDSGNIIGDTTFIEDLNPGFYNLKVTDAAGCESFAGPYEIINIGGSEITAIDKTDARCELSNASISIDADVIEGNIWYSIDNGVSWESDSLFDGLQPGSYNVLVKDENDCIADYSANPVQITNIGDALNAEANGETPICSGNDLQLTSNYENAEHQWHGPEGFADNVKDPVINNVSVDQAGLYTVVITSDDGCVDSAYTEIDVVQTIDLIPLLSSSNNPINPAEEITLSVSIPNTIINPTFEWMFDGEIMLTGGDSTFTTRDIVTTLDVSCKVYAENMCVEPHPALSNIITIEVQEINLNLPNAFKPTSTEGNNLFRPVTYSNSMPDFEMIIYDRWGKQVFITNDFKEGWDGTIDGKPAPEGVYVWIIKYDVGDETNQIQTKNQKGTVLLLR